MKNKAVQTGFTLTELVVTVAVSAIVLLLAIPDFTQTIDRNRFETQASTLQTALNLARSEAVKRNSRVTLCPSNAAGDDCDTSAPWGRGWLLFSDVESPAAAVNGRDEIIRRYDPLPAPFTLAATGSIATSGFVAFLGSGFTADNRAGSLVICKGGDLSTARGVNLFVTGRPQISQDSDGSGVHESGDGTDFSSC